MYFIVPEFLELYTFLKVHLSVCLTNGVVVVTATFRLQAASLHQANGDWMSSCLYSTRWIMIWRASRPVVGCSLRRAKNNVEVDWASICHLKREHGDEFARHSKHGARVWSNVLITNSFPGDIPALFSC